MTGALNKGQQEAADGFFEFLFSDQPELIISGPGGVGKTFLMSYLIDKILPRYFETCAIMNIPPLYTSVEMTATTNKAAEVLGVATCRPCSTIHSFLGLKITDDYATGQSKLTKSNTWRVHENVILFVDEASMIDKPLLDLIREGTHKSKVVYVGDHCQLAPVMEPISPIYKSTQIPFYELTEPMRNSGQVALIELCNQLRRTVETGIFQPIKVIPGVIDHLNDDQMQEQIAAHFEEQTLSSRILAYTNQRVIQYNDHIRTLRQLPDEYTVGEYLVNNNAIRLKSRMLSVEEEVILESMNNTSEKIPIEDGVELEIKRATLKSQLGELFYNVPILVDRKHFSDLMNYYRRKKDWARYFNLKNTYPDLRQRDAATVHKAQGSTYDSVFIDLGNISTCHNAMQVARMLYVAVSRPRSRIFLYGNLAPKYGGLIV